MNLKIASIIELVLQLKVYSLKFFRNFLNMESDSQPASYSDDKPPQWIANILGTAIGLLTLALPLLAITRYSHSNINVIPQTSYELSGYE